MKHLKIVIPVLILGTIAWFLNRLDTFPQKFLDNQNRLEKIVQTHDKLIHSLQDKDLTMEAKEALAREYISKSGDWVTETENMEQWILEWQKTGFGSARLKTTIGGEVSKIRSYRVLLDETSVMLGNALNNYMDPKHRRLHNIEPEVGFGHLFKGLKESR